MSYFDSKANIRLTAYADTVMQENTGEDSTITAIRFGGYPEMVRAMSDAIYGGGTVEAARNGEKRQFKSTPKGYRRQMNHDGVYATATLMADDDKLTAAPADGRLHPIPRPTSLAYSALTYTALTYAALKYKPIVPCPSPGG